MPSHFGPDVRDSDSEDEEFKNKQDEYGDYFEDYGFFERAQDKKADGNAEFKKERYESALKEYDACLELLLTVAYDKSIMIGNKKWNDIVCFRSLVHLNKSTCYFKMRDWTKANAEALECLMGNMRDEMMYTDPHIRAKVKASDRKHGHTGATLVEQRLPRSTRAKAWFRVSQCYARLEYLDRAREALAKSLEMADDQALLADLSHFSLKLEVLEKQQKERQKKQFAGFFDKLQDRGGYADNKKPAAPPGGGLNYDQRFGGIEDQEDDAYPFIESASGQQEETRREVVEARPFGRLTAKLQDEVKAALPEDVQSVLDDLERAKNEMINRSFEDYWAQKTSEQPPGLARALAARVNCGQCGAFSGRIEGAVAEESEDGGGGGWYCQACWRAHYQELLMLGSPEADDEASPDPAAPSSKSDSKDKKARKKEEKKPGAHLLDIWGDPAAITTRRPGRREARRGSPPTTKRELFEALDGDTDEEELSPEQQKAKQGHRECLLRIADAEARKKEAIARDDLEAAIEIRAAIKALEVEAATWKRELEGPQEPEGAPREISEMSRLTKLAGDG